MSDGDLANSTTSSPTERMMEQADYLRLLPESVVDMRRLQRAMYPSPTPSREAREAAFRSTIVRHCANLARHARDHYGQDDFNVFRNERLTSSAWLCAWFATLPDESQTALLRADVSLLPFAPLRRGDPLPKDLVLYVIRGLDNRLSALLPDEALAVFYGGEGAGEEGAAGRLRKHLSPAHRHRHPRKRLYRWTRVRDWHLAYFSRFGRDLLPDHGPAVREAISVGEPIMLHLLGLFFVQYAALAVSETGTEELRRLYAPNARPRGLNAKSELQGGVAPKEVLAANGRANGRANAAALHGPDGAFGEFRALTNEAFIGRVAATANSRAANARAGHRKGSARAREGGKVSLGSSKNVTLQFEVHGIKIPIGAHTVEKALSGWDRRCGFTISNENVVYLAQQADFEAHVELMSEASAEAFLAGPAVGLEKVRSDQRKHFLGDTAEETDAKVNSVMRLRVTVDFKNPDGTSQSWIVQRENTQSGLRAGKYWDLARYLTGESVAGTAELQLAKGAKPNVTLHGELVRERELKRKREAEARERERERAQEGEEREAKRARVDRISPTEAASPPAPAEGQAPAPPFNAIAALITGRPLSH